MPVHVQVRIKTKPVRQRMSIVPRDDVFEAAAALLHAMQYYWLFGLSDARVSRHGDDGELLIDAIAVDTNVFEVAARPPMGLEVEQVHLLRSYESLIAFSDGDWDVSFGSLQRGSFLRATQERGYWTSDVSACDFTRGDRLVLFADEHGMGSPLRCLSAEDPKRPEQLAYVPVHTVKGLKPARRLLWRWYTASFALARVFASWQEVVPEPDDVKVRTESNLQAGGLNMERALRSMGATVAQQIAYAIGHPVLYIPWRWYNISGMPEGVWHGRYDGMPSATPSQPPAGANL